MIKGFEFERFGIWMAALKFKPLRLKEAGQQSKQAEIDALKAELAQHDTLDLEPADIPHGCIVLEK